jgi:hypothetical protein
MRYIAFALSWQASFSPRQLALALREAAGLSGGGRVHHVRMVREIPGFNAA